MIVRFAEVVDVSTDELLGRPPTSNARGGY
jgi:hypothetical protein